MKNLRFFRVIISQKLESDTVPAIYRLRLTKAKALLCYSISFLLFFSSYFITLQPATKTTTEQGPTLILHTSENNYELYIDGTFYKNLTQKETYSKEYSKYEIIEGSN